MHQVWNISFATNISDDRFRYRQAKNTNIVTLHADFSEDNRDLQTILNEQNKQVKSLLHFVTNAKKGDYIYINNTLRGEYTGEISLNYFDSYYTNKLIIPHNTYFTSKIESTHRQHNIGRLTYDYYNQLTINTNGFEELALFSR